MAKKTKSELSRMIWILLIMASMFFTLYLLKDCGCNTHIRRPPYIPMMPFILTSERLRMMQEGIITSGGNIKKTPI